MSLSMDKDFEKETDSFTDSAWPRDWEDQYIDEYAEERDTFDQQSNLELDAATQKLWHSFQNSASAVTSLYKERIQGNNSWYPFQHAAGTVTLLYKESVEAQRRSYELGVQSGNHKRMRDLLTWAKKKRRHIRREDLIAILCGKSPPTKHARLSPPRSRHGSRVHTDRLNQTNLDREIGPDLTPFQNALAIQGLDGAMSNVSMGLTNSAQTSQSDDINSFIMDSLTRHNESRKRTMSSINTETPILDSPTRKRVRFL